MATKDKSFDIQALVLSPEQEDRVGSRGEGRVAWERGNGEMLVLVQRAVSLPGCRGALVKDCLTTDSEEMRAAPGEDSPEPVF